MKTTTLKNFLLIQTVIMVLILGWFYLEVTDSEGTVLIRENSPDGAYELVIQEIAKTHLLYPASRIMVALFDNNNPGYYTEFSVDISDFVKYEIEWEEDGVQIVLFGNETLCYTLPFKVEMEQ